jgi:hypothetical protein
MADSFYQCWLQLQEQLVILNVGYAPLLTRLSDCQRMLLQHWSSTCAIHR